MIITHVTAKHQIYYSPGCLFKVTELVQLDLYHTTTVFRRYLHFPISGMLFIISFLYRCKCLPRLQKIPAIFLNNMFIHLGFWNVHLFWTLFGCRGSRLLNTCLNFTIQAECQALLAPGIQKPIIATNTPPLS